jgi:hypothetical protein
MVCSPGPLIFRDETGLIWTIIASMYIGNIALIILNLPLVGVFVKLLKMPKEILFSSILVLVVIGAYAIEFSLFGLMMLGIFGVIGYLMEKGGIPVGSGDPGARARAAARGQLPAHAADLRRLVRAAGHQAGVAVDHHPHGGRHHRAHHLPVVGVETEAAR